ncbi:MAG TPA: hypothetical protein VFS04_11200, partial [Alphaproteobacteria bacterium]|nr:hypothetical protein [Alphaproteobacteria bacterium]
MASRILRARRASVSLLLCGVASLALNAAASSETAAQSYYDGETVVIGGGNAPRGSVTVDMGALDAVDGGYNAPSSAQPSRPNGRIVLTPPKATNGSAKAPAATPRATAAAPAAPAPQRAAPAPARPAPAAVASAPA